MSDRDVDQQLVERAQRGEKQAFELLVAKYQRKLVRLISRIVRDPATNPFIDTHLMESIEQGVMDRAPYAVNQ